MSDVLKMFNYLSKGRLADSLDHSPNQYTNKGLNILTFRKIIPSIGMTFQQKMLQSIEKERLHQQK